MLRFGRYLQDVNWLQVHVPCLISTFLLYYVHVLNVYYFCIYNAYFSNEVLLLKQLIQYWMQAKSICIIPLHVLTSFAERYHWKFSTTCQNKNIGVFSVGLYFSFRKSMVNQQVNIYKKSTNRVDVRQY